MNDTSKRDELAEKYQKWFHGFYPTGMTVADYCNEDMPSTIYTEGFDAGERAGIEWCLTNMPSDHADALRSKLNER